MQAACGASPVPQADPPAGPIVYPLVSARLRAAPAAASSLAGPRAGTAVSPTAAAAGEIVNFATEASSALGPIMTVGKLISSWSTSAKIALLTQEVAEMQVQIADIESDLNLADNVFYAYVQAQAQSESAIWINLYEQSFNAIQGPDGAYASFLVNMGVPTTGTWPQGTTYETIASNVAIMNALSTVALTQRTPYMQQLQDLSAAVVPLGCTDCYRVVTPAVETSGQSIMGNTSATLQVFDSLYQQLQAYVPQNNGKATTNLAEVMESYNSEIMAIYQQNVVALQEAYTIEATQNYLNYVNGQAAGGTAQIASPEGSPSLTYTYSGLDAAAEQQNLANAQEQLALLYAARLNTLFVATMSYVVSDPPFADYAWPAPPTFTNNASSNFTDQQLAEINAWITAHPYSGFVKLNKPARSIVGTLGEVMPTVQQAPYIFYQYDGLNQVYACSNELFQDGVALDATSCPPLFASSTGATWTGTELSVYSDSHGTPALTPVLDLATASASITSPLVLYSGQTSNGSFLTSLLPSQIAAGSISQGAGSPATTRISLAGSTTNLTFDFGFPVSNLLPGGGQSWFEVKSPTQQVANMQQFSGIANQMTGDDGFVGAFFVNWQPAGHEALFEVGLACVSGDPYCWVLANGICLGGIDLVMSCKDGETCTVASAGSCGP